MTDFSLSFSQMKLAKENPLRYCIQYCEKIWPPPTDALLFGRDFDTSVEMLINEEALPVDDTSTCLDVGGKKVSAQELAQEWASNSQTFIGDRKGRMKTQSAHELELEGLPIIKGYSDLVVTPKDSTSMIEIYDFKTCTFNRDGRDVFYGLNQDDLKSDLQLATYALASLGEPVTEESLIFLGHIQLVKEKVLRKVHKVWFRWVYDLVRGEDLLKSREQIIRDAKHAVELRKIYNSEKDPFKALTLVAKQFGYASPIDMYEATGATFSYGQKCPFLNYIRGRESLEDLKERYPNQRRK